MLCFVVLFLAQRSKLAAVDLWTAPVCIFPISEPRQPSSHDDLAFVCIPIMLTHSAFICKWQRLVFSLHVGPRGEQSRLCNIWLCVYKGSQKCLNNICDVKIEVEQIVFVWRKSFNEQPWLKVGLSHPAVVCRTVLGASLHSVTGDLPWPGF